ncbi:hypothetical protein FOXG_21774 [Fusarium oxysporum f. sp. lycopersici 4287]|uniref:Uncharacterized protein n=1 Tax=Fusarium oxysporum f. sp. lycopersici (strain 4287 / CBS 123668 / FGSC 9935 / NRRL 34936) TaxID=426428 RepID=A0A0J9W0V6_FUSO4|nr:hypothetical protein FOXG_21774 [Fusarium oxysporum f. sp. lycopersici 4287]KNB16729.1 hypothetical protein FOXG_21774 [Fusarium oxysporum f. sp. lycopersici 4287]
MAIQGAELHSHTGPEKGGRDGEEYGCSYLKDDPQYVNISKTISQRKIIGFGSAWHKNQGADDGKAQEW